MLEIEISKLILCSTNSALTVEESDRLKLLETNRDAILCAEENCWRLRSRATWLKSRDSNSKYFHKISSFNRNRKLIWSIKSNGVDFIQGQEAIKEEAIAHFTHQYKATTTHNLSEKVATARLFPQLVSAVEAEDLYKPVNLVELKDILLHFKTERSPGPDGWTS